MELIGKIFEIIFYNEDNGYSVLDLDADSRLVTAVGIFPMVSVGESVKLIGEFTEHNKYGEQFSVESVEFLKPNTNQELVMFLSSGLIKGIGEPTAKLIVSKFGDKTLDILDNNIDKLLEIKGIGKSKIAIIKESYQHTIAIRGTLLSLQKYHISNALAVKLYEKYNDDAEKVLIANPYILVDDIDGVGFLTADKVAEKLGVAKDSLFRIKAGLNYILMQASLSEGHTYLPKAILIAKTLELLGVASVQQIEAAIEEACNQKKIISLQNISGIAEASYSLSVNYFSELKISANLMALNKAVADLDVDVIRAIEIFEEQHNIYFHKLQKVAIMSALKNGISVITGGPGTGKTTIIKCILSILQSRGHSVALTSPTGRASQRMTEATGLNAKTIHRLLGVKVERGKFVPSFHETHQLEFDCIIIDEISMADIYIFNDLLKAIQLGTRVVLVGDKDQLPSVNAGSILSDIIESQIFSVTHLTEIYRQNSKSYIVVNAHKINNGEMPIIDNTSIDFFLDRESDPNKTAAKVVALYKSRIPNYFGIDTSKIQVLAPIKKTIVGIENLNVELRNGINQPLKVLKYKDREFWLNDKVMHIKNNYDIEWYQDEVNKGVFNGDIGYVADISEGSLLVKFNDGKLVEYTGEVLDELTLAYAITVHKSQGSEFDAVILALGNVNNLISTRSLLYTAITRAKKLVVVVGTEEIIQKMVANNYTAKRFTLLNHFLIDIKERNKLLYGKN